MRRVHVVVTGEVQGVGYRFMMRLAAQRMGAAGWVRNRRDGSVEAELEGEDAAVRAVLAWAAAGPPGGRVDDVHVTDVAVQDETGFAILPTP